MNTKLNKSDWIIIIICYAISITVTSLQYYRQDNMLKEYLIDFSVSTIMSLIIILIFMYWLIPIYLVHKQKYFHFISLCLLLLFFGGFIDFTAGFWSGENNWDKYPKGVNLVLRCVFELTDEIGIIMGVLLTKKFYEGQTEFIKIQKKQKENELKLLRSQLDPHFLFNNLNTLDSLIDTQPEKAKEYINRLSLIYRYLIQTKDSKVMELSEEINLAENYIFLINTRFGSDYDFSIQKKTTIQDKFIPTGAIQTLLENVVKHNKKIKNAIRTTITVEDEHIKITNTKSIVKPKNESFGTGLDNLKIRYKYLSDKEMIIVDTKNEFKVMLPIINLTE